MDHGATTALPPLGRGFASVAHSSDDHEASTATRTRLRDKLVKDSLLTVARVGPPSLTSSNSMADSLQIVEHADGHTIRMMKGGGRVQSGHVDACLQPLASLREEFALTGELVLPLLLQRLERANEGRDCVNGCILSYGHAGLGKAHALMGTAGDGVLPQILRRLFEAREATPGMSVKLSLLELYCEDWTDLILPRSRAAVEPEKLTMRVGRDRSVYIDRLTVREIGHPDDALKLIERGSRARRVSRTSGSGGEVARSHLVVTLIVVKERPGKAPLHFKLHLVDLASERPPAVASKPSGMTSSKPLSAVEEPRAAKEAIAINKSVGELENVVHALVRGKAPSFRKSKLTMLLQDSLGPGALAILLLGLAADDEQALRMVRHVRARAVRPSMSTMPTTQIVLGSARDIVKHERGSRIKVAADVGEPDEELHRDIRHLASNRTLMRHHQGMAYALQPMISANNVVPIRMLSLEWLLQRAKQAMQVRDQMGDELEKMTLEKAYECFAMHCIPSRAHLERMEKEEGTTAFFDAQSFLNGYDPNQPDAPSKYMLVVCHPWYTRQHPDPLCDQLIEFHNVIERNMRECNFPSPQHVGVVWDYSSLSMLNGLFAHAHTIVIILNASPPSLLRRMVEDLHVREQSDDAARVVSTKLSQSGSGGFVELLERGWPVFEICASHLLKSSSKTRHSSFPRICWSKLPTDVQEAVKFKRRWRHVTPKDLSEWLRRAAWLKMRGDHERAIEIYTALYEAAHDEEW